MQPSCEVQALSPQKSAYLHTLSAIAVQFRLPILFAPFSVFKWKWFPLAQGVHVNRCKWNQIMPFLPAPSSHGNCHVIAKRWHINGAPLQGSFLLMSLHKTIRWLEEGHGGTRVARLIKDARWSLFKSASGTSWLTFFQKDSINVHRSHPRSPAHRGGAHTGRFTHDATAALPVLKLFLGACFHDEHPAFTEELRAESDFISLYCFFFWRERKI